MENPASSRGGKCRSGCSNRVQGEKNARVLIRLARTGAGRAWEGSLRQVCSSQKQVRSARQRVRSARRRIRKFKKNRATTGTQHPTTGVTWTTMAEIARRRVAGRATTGLTPRGRFASTVYKGGRLVRDSCFD